MLITVERFVSNNDATASIVSIDNRFCCFGLEDEHREEKVASETRIPSGLYKVGVRTYGGFHNRYKQSQSLKHIHRGMLEILDVPNFTDILIHIGNDDDDTAGCLLVGKTLNTLNKIYVGSSAVAYIEFYEKVIEAALNDDLQILYLDNDLNWS